MTSVRKSKRLSVGSVHCQPFAWPRPWHMNRWHRRGPNVSPRVSKQARWHPRVVEETWWYVVVFFYYSILFIYSFFWGGVQFCSLGVCMCFCWDLFPWFGTAWWFLNCQLQLYSGWSHHWTLECIGMDMDWDRTRCFLRSISDLPLMTLMVESHMLCNCMADHIFEIDSWHRYCI